MRPLTSEPPSAAAAEVDDSLGVNGPKTGCFGGATRRELSAMAASVDLGDAARSIPQEALLISKGPCDAELGSLMAGGGGSSETLCALSVKVLVLLPGESCRQTCPVAETSAERQVARLLPLGVCLPTPPYGSR